MKKNISRIIALMIAVAVLFMTASCSSENKKITNADFDILGMDYAEYQKEYSAKRYETTSETLLNAFYAKQTDDVTYYYGSDSILVGVKDNKVVFYGYLTSSVFTVTSFPKVKDVLEFESLSVLCESVPEITETQANILFALWEIRNGYTGIGSVGSSDYKEVYGNMATVFIAFSEQYLCSLY